MKKENNKDMPKLRPVVSVVTILALLATLAGGVTLAKYTMDQSRASSIQPESFCFESAVMADTALSFDVYDWSSSELTVRNFNGLLQACDDITYNLTITPDAENSENSGCTVLRNAAAYTLGSTVTLTGASDSTDAYTLSFTGEVGDSFTVTAVSGTPYRKTISAVLTLRDSEGGSFYSVTGYGSYAVMKVKTGTAAIELDVNWSNAWVPDNAGTLTENWTASPQELSLEANSTYSIIFFRSGSSYLGTVGETPLMASPTVTLPE